LRFFLLHADRDFYQAQLVALSGGRLYLAQRELARLERAGLILREQKGNRVYYRANLRHPAFEDLKRAFLKTVALGDSLRSALAPLSDRVRVAFIYGSFATGEERPESDVDLFIVGELTAEEETDVLGEASKKLGRELNTAVFPPEEFRKKARAGHYFVEDVLRNPKVFVIGDEDELAGLAGRESAALPQAHAAGSHRATRGG
jgi:predicted nucleotidyltransferase